MTNVTLPQAVALELTYRCNHKCIFCSCPWYAPGNNYPVGKELDCEQWLKAINILFEHGVQAFSISGGECTLKDCMPQLVEYIRTESDKRGYNHPIVLISNALEMSDEYLRLFKRYNVHLSMSLPGYETFEQHTGVDNAESVLEWFKKAKSYGITTTLNVTVTAKNIHELFETVSLGLINGASSVLLNRFLPGGRGLSNIEELILTNKQLNEMLKVTEEVLQLSNRYGSVGTEIPLCAVDNPKQYRNLNIGYKCAAAKGFFVIDPSGNIRTCNHSPRIVGNVFAKPMIEDVNYWNTFAHSLYKPDYCRNCKALSSCDASCREVANILKGSPCEIDPTLKPKIRNYHPIHD